MSGAGLLLDTKGSGGQGKAGLHPSLVSCATGCAAPTPLLGHQQPFAYSRDLEEILSPPGLPLHPYLMVPPAPSQSQGLAQLQEPKETPG